MKKLFLHPVLLLSVLLAFVLNSCLYYESDVPISNSKKSVIDTTFLGHWEVKNMFTEDSIEQYPFKYATIMAFNEHEYLIRLLDFQDSTVTSVLLFKMYNSVVKKKQVYNLFLMEPDEKDVKYVFLCCDKANNDSLLLTILMEEYSEDMFDSPQKLKKHITKNSEKFFSSFGPYVTLVRRKKLPLNFCE